MKALVSKFHNNRKLMQTHAYQGSSALSDTKKIAARTRERRSISGRNRVTTTQIHNSMIYVEFILPQRQPYHYLTYTAFITINQVLLIYRTIGLHYYTDIKVVLYGLDKWAMNEKNYTNGINK